MIRHTLKIAALIGASLIANIAVAGPECTTEARSTWMPEAQAQAKLREQYTVEKFKVTSGNCYEIYGADKTGKKVEIYFHPVTLAIVKIKAD